LQNDFYGKRTLHASQWAILGKPWAIMVQRCASGHCEQRLASHHLRHPGRQIDRCAKEVHRTERKCDYPTANALARRVQRNNSRELAAYAIIARSEPDDSERRWMLLKGERAAQKLITPVPITKPGYMAAHHFKHFAINRTLLARDYWRAGPRQNKHLAIDLCKEVLWREIEDPHGLRFDYYNWCMELHAHTAVAGMLEIRGPQDLPAAELQKIISLMQTRGDHGTAARLASLAADSG